MFLEFFKKLCYSWKIFIYSKIIRGYLRNISVSGFFSVVLYKTQLLLVNMEMSYLSHQLRPII